VIRLGLRNQRKKERKLDGHPLGGCGLGFGLVTGYTTLSVRVQTNTSFGAFKIKSVRTKTASGTEFSVESKGYAYHLFPNTYGGLVGWMLGQETSFPLKECICTTDCFVVLIFRKLFLGGGKQIPTIRVRV